MTKNTTKSSDTEIQVLKRGLIDRIAQGDFITLGKIMKIESGTARMRFHRANKEAVTAMNLVIENRENFIKKES
jgi:hypothetical protein